VTKEYISRRDLRELGFAEPDSIFNALHSEINKLVTQYIRADIDVEIKANHSKHIMAEYTRLLESHGFDSTVIQDWLEYNIPALRQIELECREMALHDFKKD